MRRNEGQIRYTHIPTGESVVVRFDRPKYMAEADRHARAILTARVHREPMTPRPTRSYTLAPEWAVSVRQGGRTIAEGVEAVVGMLEGRGKFPVLPLP